MSHPIPQDIPIRQRGFSIFVELGYEPTVRFEEGLSRLYEWYEMWMYVVAWSASVSLAEDPLVGELVKELSKRYDERQMAQSGLRKDNPKLERLDRKIRALRTNLQFINPGVPKQCLTITSSISGEGKTFISINMASVLALGGKKVVLLGVVLRKPKIFNDFGLTNNADLTTYLIGKHSIQEIIQPTGKGTLDLIAAGPIPPNPSELLLDAKFGELIAWLKQHYDYIVMDTPPVTLIADAIELMRYSDANIYVMRQNYTKREIIKYVDQLRQNGQLSNGCIVLNDYQMDVPYGYGYGYGFGYCEEEVQVKKPFWKRLLP